MSVRNNFVRSHAVDARWFLALKAIKRPLILRSLSIDSSLLAVEKEKVFSNLDYNPIFTYPQLQADEIKAARVELIKLRAIIYQEEVDPSIQLLYIDKISECILEQELLLASADGRYEDFQIFNLQLYGSLNHTFIEEHLAVLQSRYQIFNQRASVRTESNLVPTLNEFALAKTLISGPDIAVLPDRIYTSEDLVAAWNSEFEKSLSSWKVVIDTNVVHLLVDHKHRTVRIPANIQMKSKKMRKLFVHEIGTHVYRREQGKQSRLQLASIGLASYQAAEEGLAIMRAQLVSERFYRFGGLDKYLAIALATGKIDGTAKNFSETFYLLEKYYTARLVRNKKTELILKVAKERAWNSTLRLFRGGNPSLPGCCFLRDKIYHEGNRAMWSLVQSNPEYLVNVMEGKYDPGKASHREAMLQFML